jgi:hypothetical protein
MSLRDKFLKRASTREIVEFDAGLDEPVFLRPMRKATKSRVESIVSKGEKTAKDCSDLRFYALRDCLCDSDGVEILSAADREAFDQMDESFVEPIFNRVLEISGLTQAEVEELEKN